jgi:Alginate export
MHTRHAARPLIVIGIVTAALGARPAAADDTGGTTFLDAVTKGTFSLGLRYRFEDVEQDGFDDPGRASTLHTTLGYRTGWWSGLAAFLQVEDVHDIGFAGEHNNSGSGSLWNGVSDRPVIADPEITELHQAYLDWRPAEKLSVRGGMHEITLGNQRFVGNVGWRQNRQSFEGVRVDFTGLADTTLTYAWVARVQQISGASRPMDSHLAELEHVFAGIGALRAYGYLLDWDEESQAGLSTLSYGASLAGAPKLSERVTLPYRIELAQQSDAGDNPSEVNASYWRLDLGVSIGAVTVVAGYELLGGDPSRGAFSTPLATLHGFNGWADKFLTTPANGLEDLSLSAAAALGRWKLEGAVHEYSADAGGASWGSELDLQIVYTAPWKQSFAAKASFYDADDWATDTDKLWLYTEWGF